MERTLLINGRFPELGNRETMVVFNHASPVLPPDLMGYAGPSDAPEAPDARHPLAEDAVLDLEGALLLPGLVDLDIGLDQYARETEPFVSYRGYRLAADALYRGITSVGVTKHGPILDALCTAANDYTLWTPQIAVWDPADIPEAYTVFFGAPEAGTAGEAAYLEKVRAARENGKKPAVATGKGPRELVDGLYPLVRAAQLLCRGGYSIPEALEAITCSNAAILGLTGKTGALRTGLEGDVIVAPIETLEDIAALQKMCMTARGGRLIWSHMKAMDRIRFCVAPPGCE